jgi:hypothetical protein
VSVGEKSKEVIHVADNLKMYVVTKDGVPAISITSNMHREFNKESLDEALDAVTEFAGTLRKSWDDKDWFPCGFVSMKIDSGSPLVSFLKKNAENDQGYYRYKGLTGTKRSGTGWTLYFKTPDRDAITSQCMKYNTRVAEALQKLLAFLNIPVGVETMID